MTDEQPGTPPGLPENAPAPLEAPIAEPLVPAGPNPLGGSSRRYDMRFGAVYVTLGAVLIAAMVAFGLLVVKPGHKPAAAWSSWQPDPGTATVMAKQIADHVAHSYRVSTGGEQLVTVIPSKPTVTSGTTPIAIKAIAVRKSANTNTGIEVITGGEVTGAEMFTFCGLGTRCAITAGKASRIRGRLVRREALEVALYTFKFVPSIKSVIAFMPPAPDDTTTLLFLRRANFKDELSKPLRSTLSRKTPPLPTDSDVEEADTIDSLTLPNTFSYALQALQTGGAAFVLDPAT